ncbi:MAG: dynamin family protein, partial [Roseobacter sp.]
MNILNSSDETVFAHAAQADLLRKGLEDCYGFAESVGRLKDALETLRNIGDDNMLRRAERMLRQLDNFEPSVTMIGQIKSGKTSLVNALIGAPDLLPADVNPWTSVVTSLHLHPECADFEASASFRFFDEDEWDRLISGGGRIGELASRAGADEELEKIKRQVSDMREKSRARLGKKFEMLLGQQRDYGFVDKDLVERYVCLGEDLGDEEQDRKDVQGRFADITKSADLSLQRAALPMRLCLRDTPGVNDTFMMREQITIRAIRDSRICVVVLSAHQALSSTDMALIRLISQVKSRDVVIFVNRVDELSTPADQVSQIRESITRTLERHKGPREAEVIFGSALWAGFALQGRVDELPSASARALQNLAARTDGKRIGTSLTVPDVWDMSGLPQLQAAIADRIVNGVGAATLQRIGASARNLASGLAAADRIATSEANENAARSLDGAEASRKIEEACARQAADLDAEFTDIIAAFSDRMDRVQES